MINNAEQRVSRFYNTIGWEQEGQITEDAKRFEDLRKCAREYVSQCRLRVLKYIPDQGENILDMASGPIQYKEYLEYSRNYQKRYCVDLSSKALDDAQRKIGNHGVFLCGSFFDINLEDNFFDCAISLHTIYHIDKDKQEEVVKKLIAVTKTGKAIVIVYRNPHSLSSPLRLFQRIGKLLRNTENSADLYIHAHPIRWWDRFSDVANIQVIPWRSFPSPVQKILFPNNKLGTKMFDILFKMEQKFPSFFVKYCEYPMIIINKKSAKSYK